MIFYSVQKEYHDDILFYQVFPYDFFESLRLRPLLKDKINFIKNGSFYKKKAKNMADRRNLEEFNKRKGY